MGHLQRVAGLKMVKRRSKEVLSEVLHHDFSGGVYDHNLSKRKKKKEINMTAFA